MLKAARWIILCLSAGRLGGALLRHRRHRREEPRRRLDAGQRRRKAMRPILMPYTRYMACSRASMSTPISSTRRPCTRPRSTAWSSPSPTRAPSTSTRPPTTSASCPRGRLRASAPPSPSRDGKIIIVAPIKGTPADEAGIRSGDVILAVNGESTEGWNVEKAVIEDPRPQGHGGQPDDRAQRRQDGRPHADTRRDRGRERLP